MTDRQKEEYLISIMKKAFSGDNYYAKRSVSREKWNYGYINDYPMQHGNGRQMVIDDRVLELMMTTNCS